LKNNLPIIIPDGKYKGMRLYLENEMGGEHILPIEMHYLFMNAFKNNFRVFLLKTQPNHNIIIPDNDLKFLNKSIKYEEINMYLDYNFSKDVLNIKKLQHQDIITLYKLAIEQNQIKALFFHPILKNNLYIYDIFIIIDQNFNFDDILKLKFNLIKISSYIEYYSNTLTLELTHKMYDLLNVQFKDYIVPIEEKMKT